MNIFFKVYFISYIHFFLEKYFSVNYAIIIVSQYTIYFYFIFAPCTVIIFVSRCKAKILSFDWSYRWKNYPTVIRYWEEKISNEIRRAHCCCCRKVPSWETNVSAICSIYKEQQKKWTKTRLPSHDSICLLHINEPTFLSSPAHGIVSADFDELTS